MPKDAAHSAVPTQSLTKVFTFWQDRDVRFDSSADALAMRQNAEEVLATFHHVEDTKGNSGQIGTLLVTNLRILWWSAKRRSVNLSVGYHCVLNITAQEATSKLFRGAAEAIFLSCKFGSSRFLFVFTHVPQTEDTRSSEGPTRLFAAAHAAWRAYDATRIYRELRLRGAIIADGNLILLAGESVLSKMPNVSNVSKDSGHPGTLLTTNLRVAWFADASDNFNISIPYMQFTAVRSQSSRFGPALVIETSSYAGNFVLGFRVEPVERLRMLYQEIASLWKVWTAKPFLGMQTSLRNDGTSATAAAGEDFTSEEAGGGWPSQEKSNPISSAARTKVNETAVIEQAPCDAFAAYYADDGQKSTDRKPVFDPTIGLAVEKLRKGVSLKELWSVTGKS